MDINKLLNRFRFLAEVSTNLQKMPYFQQFKDHNSGGKKNKLDKWPHFFHLIFELCLWYSFSNLKNIKICFHGVPPLQSILVCKVTEFQRWKLWDQNFAPFNSGNIHIKESKEPGLTFSIELRTKFVWSHGLSLLLTFTNFCHKILHSDFLNLCLRVAGLSI